MLDIDFIAHTAAALTSQSRKYYSSGPAAVARSVCLKRQKQRFCKVAEQLIHSATRAHYLDGFYVQCQTGQMMSYVSHTEAQKRARTRSVSPIRSSRPEWSTMQAAFSNINVYILRIQTTTRERAQRTHKTML